MKRILILLLLLVVAGGLFAQLNWSGSVLGGLGMTLADGADGPSFGIGTNGGGNVRLRVNGVYTNDEGTAGGSFRLQQQANPTNWASGFSVPYAQGWMSFADGFVKVLGGRISNSEFASVDSWVGNNLSGGYGLQAHFFPADLFKFGLGARASDSIFAGKNMDVLTGWLGLGVDTDLVGLAAQLEAGKDNINAFLSAGFYGLDDFDLDAYAGFSTLNNFSEEGEVEASVYVGYAGIDKLYAYADFNPIIPMDGSDLVLPFAVGVEYEASDLLTCALDVTYVLQGGSYDGYTAWDLTYDKGNSYLGINPTFTFAATSRANLSLGYVLGVDLGDATGINHAAFLEFNWSF